MEYETEIYTNEEGGGAFTNASFVELSELSDWRKRAVTSRVSRAQRTGINRSEGSIFHYSQVVLASTVFERNFFPRPASASTDTSEKLTPVKWSLRSVRTTTATPRPPSTG